MKGVFRRGLSDAIHQDLLGGPCSTILRACLDAGLYVCLRDNYLNAYYRGRSLAKIAGRSRQPPELKINHKYLIADRIGDYTGRRSGDYRAFDVDTAFAEFYAVHLGSMIMRAREYVRPEDAVESTLLERNDNTAVVSCFDRQIQVPGIRKRLDVMGFLAGDTTAIVAIEVKRYPDRRIQFAPRQLHRYLEVFDPTQEGLREDVARSYRTVCEQLRTLGLSAPDPTQITAGMPVLGLVIVSDYNRRSRLLPRAHELAAKLVRPIHLWQPAEGEFVIPVPEQWIRMGLT